MIPVSSVEYVNVRIRAAHSRLLTSDVYETLMEGDTLGTLTTFLLDHQNYRVDIDLALKDYPEREGLEQGVTDCFGRSINHAYRMSEGYMRELFSIGLSSFDLRNIRTILIAHKRGIPFHEIRHVLIPCETLSRAGIEKSYIAGNTHDLLQNLTTCCPLVTLAIRTALNDKREGEPVVDLINRLEQNLYNNIFRRLDTSDEDVRILKNVYRYEVDLKNIVSSLKHIWRRAASKQGTERYIRGGTLNENFLHDLMNAKNLDEAFEMIETTEYHEAVEKGVIYYAETGFLHEMERFFEEVFIRRTQTYRRTHPFGVGPFIAYIWAHYAEVTNLRTIINGIAFRTGAGQMRKGLIDV